MSGKKESSNIITEDYNCAQDCRICPFPGAKCTSAAAMNSVYRERNPLLELNIVDEKENKKP